MSTSPQQGESTAPGDQPWPPPGGSTAPGYQPWPPPGGAGGPVLADGRPAAPGFVTASMGRRLAARVVDGLVLGVPAVLLLAALGGLTALLAEDTGEPAVAPLVLLALLVYVVLPLVAIAYEVVLTARGGTPGKRVLGLRVVQRGTGALPGTGPALLRWLIFFAASWVVLVGTVLVALSPFFDRTGIRQGWHDLAAGTRVVDVRGDGRAPTA